MSDAFLDATARAELVRSGEAAPAELVEEAIGRIGALNGDLDDGDLTQHFITLWSAGNAWSVAHERRTGKRITADDVDSLTWALVETGRSFSAPQFLEAVEWTRQISSFWADDGFDLLLTPTIAEPPPFNVSGQPAISLPLHWNPGGLPIGVHLVGAYGREDLLLRAASQLEQAQPWADPRPGVHA